MRARRFPLANKVYELQGGTEDNSLWAETGFGEYGPYIRSVWVPTDEERALLGSGHNISLVVLGQGTPPVAMSVTPEQPGRAPA